jgi:hypothetical protein
VLFFRILLGLIIVNTLALLLFPFYARENNKLKNGLAKALIMLVSCATITVVIYSLFPEDQLASEFFRSGIAQKEVEPERILIDRYEIVSLSPNELNNLLTKRKTPYLLELHDIKPSHADNLSNIIKNSTLINSLSLSRLQEKTPTQVYKALGNNNSITSIYINDCLNCINDMKPDIQWPNNLKVFSVTSSQLNMRAIENINIPPDIKTLIIEQCTLNTNNIKNILNKLPNGLKRVSFSHNKLTSSSIELLIPWFLENTDLEYIDISYNKITERGLVNLLETMSKQSNVKEIILSKNATTSTFDGKIKNYKGMVKNDQS